MISVGELLAILEEIAPPNLAFQSDPIGLQVGRKSDRVERIVVALDPTPAALEFCKSCGANALITHHALIYNPVAQISGDSMQVRAIRAALANNIAVMCAHTNWDAAEGGVNDTLVKMLGLSNVRTFGNDLPQSSYKLITFVPADALENIIASLSAIGCGEIGLYRRCAFTSEGQGTFEPQLGANPIVGEIGRVENANEIRLEMLVPGVLRDAAENTLRENHPYDEPAFDFFLRDETPLSLPRMGELSKAQSLRDVSANVEALLMTKTRTFGAHDKKISTVAVVGGAGGSYWLKAHMADCDALVTGEVRHHEAVEAAESGFALIEAGHFATENPAMLAMAERLKEKFPKLSIEVYEPEEGLAGRPLASAS